MAFTFFFRDMHVLDLIRKHVISDLVGFSKSRVWDAGCAMGPEPYSLAMVFAESMGTFGFRNLRIDATDIDEGGDFQEVIARGIYPMEVLNRLPEGFLRKYFEPTGEGDLHQVREAIRSRIRFQRHDLLSLRPVGSGYHLIVCKNVLLHFQPSERTAVIRMFHGALAPGGYFATEQTQKMPDELDSMFSRVTPDGQLYMKN
jgi:chemotaxis protein methyltransferase CheR